jgi:ABC-type lipoprotein export system ATPase subunit
MAEPLLVIDRVEKCFRRGRQRWQVLKEASLTLHAGEMLGVVGARGEGKSTLLETAAGLQSPDGGSVIFEGRNLASLGKDRRDALLGDRIAWMNGERVGLLDVLEDVGIPLLGRGLSMREIDDRAMQALERVGAADAARKSWDELSNWERVLVVFARGYISRPRLMVVDDLLDGLGPRGTREAGELLLSFVEELQCGVLAAASDLESVLVAPRVVYFDHGKLVVMSEPANLVQIGSRPRSAEHGRHARA